MAERKRQPASLVLLLCLLLAPRCARIKVEPIKIEPIHVTLDVNVKVVMERRKGDLEAAARALDDRDFDAAVPRAKELVALAQQRWYLMKDKDVTKAEEFRKLALELVAQTNALEHAATRRDIRASRQALGEVRNVCNACHARFRRR